MKSLGCALTMCIFIKNIIKTIFAIKKCISVQGRVEGIFKAMLPLATIRCTFFSTSATPRKEGRKEMFYLTTHSTHFIDGYMASDIW